MLNPDFPAAFASLTQALAWQERVDLAKRDLSTLCASAAMHRLADAFSRHPGIASASLSVDPEGGYGLDLSLAPSDKSPSARSSELCVAVMDLCDQSERAAKIGDDAGAASLQAQWLALDAIRSEFDLIFSRFCEEAPDRFWTLTRWKGAARIASLDDPIALAEALGMPDIASLIEASALRERLAPGNARSGARAL